MRRAELIPSARDDLLNALYASVSEVPAWTSFVRVARDIFACEQAAVMVGAREQGAPVGAYANEMLAATIDALFSEAAPAMIEGQVCACTAGGGAALVLPVVDASRRAASIVLWRGGGAAPFDSNERSVLMSLADPLRRSLQIYYRFVDLVRRQGLSEIALETSRIGVVMVSIDGDVMLTNSVADQLLGCERGLHVVRGRLRAGTGEESETLLAEIRRSALSQAAEVDPKRYVPMAFSRQDSALPLTVMVRPGPGFWPLRQPLRRTAILVLRDPDMQAPWPAATLKALFGLSVAEALLASELAKGASLEEAASVLGISRNTARTQLQSIFLKTGTNRQSDLIRVLLNSAAGSA